jgi:hypothetical protein
MHGLQNALEEIDSAWSALQGHWRETRAYSFDAACFWFDKVYWEKYDPELRSVLGDFEEVGEILAQAYRALE